jgi:regulator of protease activity HflC (stomatin/prohibitin superfamily)
MIQEKKRSAVSGILAVVVLLVVVAITVGVFVAVARDTPKSEVGKPLLLFLLALALEVFLFAGLFTVQPNQGVLLQLFGDYTGTVKQPGLRWANPFYSKKHVSMRVRNFETGRLKVNDQDGNPIEIAAVVVWRVVDTAEAVFHVDNFENYVHVQSEAALRNLATAYPFDSHEEAHMSLRGHTAAVATQLQKEVHERLTKAGVEVLEARLSVLAYAPEIAAAMLRRQQAGAVIAARQMIVDGAVGMVEMALDRLARNNVVELDGDRKAAMVSNLMVVLCSEHATQPVVNTGTLYH